jgi:hypothetical protein
MDVRVAAVSGTAVAMPTHRLDRWLRAHYLWLRLALAAVVALEGVAWWLNGDVLAGILAVPSAVVVTLVMLYLPCTPLEGHRRSGRPGSGPATSVSVSADGGLTARADPGRLEAAGGPGDPCPCGRSGRSDRA